MPRYYFHIRNGSGAAEDEEGRDLPDVESARAEAIKGVRSIISDEVKQGLINLRGEIHVAQDTGEAVFTLRFDEAVTIVREPEE